MASLLPLLLLAGALGQSTEPPVVDARLAEVGPAPVTRLGTDPPAPARPAPGSRSHEVFRVDCASGVARRDVTLFANGTLRLREAPGESLVLLELGPVALDGLLQRLAQVPLDEIASAAPRGAEGALSDHCRLLLDLPDWERPRRFELSRLESQPLGLGNLMAIADELTARLRESVAVAREASELPVGYRPRSGDRLERRDGQVWEVVMLTVDGRGVELRGRDQPLVIYMAIDALRAEFKRLVPR
jgi:hypothetical protein